MDILTTLLLILVLSIFLAKSTDIVIKNVIKIARKFSIPEFAVGFFILGFATSLPEIFVAINAVISNNPALSLGNLMGASFVLLTLAMAIPAIISGKVLINKLISSKDILLSAFVVSLPAFVAFDGKLTRVDGVILFLAYLTYVYIMNEKDSFVEKFKGALKKDKEKLGKLLVLLIIGVLGIFLSSKLIVTLSLDLASTLLIPSVVMGIVFLSIGTNLPELTLALKSSFSNHKNVGVGDFLGSAAVNTFVFSLLCFIKPFEIKNIESVRVTAIFLVAGVIILSIFLKTKKTLSRKEGLILISLYILFLLGELLELRFLKL